MQKVQRRFIIIFIILRSLRFCDKDRKRRRFLNISLFKCLKVFRRLGVKKYLYYLTNIENIQNYLYENRQID